MSGGSSSIGSDRGMKKKTSRRGFWGREYVEVETFKNDRDSADELAASLEEEGYWTDISISHVISDLKTPYYTVHRSIKKKY